MGERFSEPRDAGLVRCRLHPDRRRDRVPSGQGPATGDGDRRCGDRRPVLVQGAATSRVPRPREERRSGEACRSRRLWHGQPVTSESVGRLARVRERLRGHRTSPPRRGRSPASRRCRRTSTRWRPGRRRAIVAIHPERNGCGGGPGGRRVTKVGVIGAGMTLFRRRLEETGKELCFEATKMALDSAGLTRADVDMVVCGSAPDAFDGVAMKGEYLLDGSGGYRKPYTRVFTGGGTGVFSTIAGWWPVAPGLAGGVPVGEGEKKSSCQPHPQRRLPHIWGPIPDRPLQPQPRWVFPIGMDRHQTLYGVKKEDIARVAVKNKRNAVGHPCAQLADPNITV